MPQDPTSPHAIRVADLSPKRRAFKVMPDTPALREWAATLGLSALRKLTFTGALTPAGKRDWQLEATLGASFEQPCTVTLNPVRTRVDVPVKRRFVADFEATDDPESEMPEDDSVEALGAWIDLETIMIEALSLEIPDYPRSPDIDFEGARFADKNVVPMTDEAARPFAGLAGLRDQLKEEDDETRD